jgi:hypothetical protein
MQIGIVLFQNALSPPRQSASPLYRVPVQKWGISPGFKAGDGFKPEEYFIYFEDLDSVPNAALANGALANAALANAHNRVRGAFYGQELVRVAHCQFFPFRAALGNGVGLIILRKAIFGASE